jgi:hypothetical protein
MFLEELDLYEKLKNIKYDKLNFLIFDNKFITKWKS